MRWSATRDEGEVVSVGNVVMFVLLARIQRFRLRWGVTVTGLALGSGRGTFPAACLVGFWALASGTTPGPSRPTAARMILIGALAGVVYGLIPRHPRLGQFRGPTLQRVALCCIAGGVAVPPLVAFGHMPTDTANPVGVIVLSGGALGVLAYVLAQRRRFRSWIADSHTCAGYVDQAILKQGGPVVDENRQERPGWANPVDESKSGIRRG